MTSPPPGIAVLEDMMDQGTKDCRCCGARHDAAAWYALVFVGVQVVPADMFGPEERYELRNCGCGSTLARVEVG